MTKICLKCKKQQKSEKRRSVMSNFVIEDGVLVKYDGNEEKVIIPDGVISIGKNVFEENRTIVEVSIPSSVEAILYRAFYMCENLNKVTFSFGLKKICSGAFAYCNKLEKIEFPESLIEIESCAFQYCVNLSKVVLPESLSIIARAAVRKADGVFGGCEKLCDAGPVGTGYSIEYSWRDKIPNNAFYGSELREIYIAEEITSIGYKAFYRCNPELKVYIPLKDINCACAFDGDVKFQFVNKNISKENIISDTYLMYLNEYAWNQFTPNELATLILYQSKQWRKSILADLYKYTASKVIDVIINELATQKKISKKYATILIEVLAVEHGTELFEVDYEKVKLFLKEKNCVNILDVYEFPEVINNIQLDTKQLPCVGCKIGDTIQMGEYPQNEEGEKRAIRWKIIAIEEHRALIISENGLINMPYHQKCKDIKWEKCDLRVWLNEIFLTEAFSPLEVSFIDRKNAYSELITLLSDEEVKMYFKDYTECVAKASDYAKKSGVDITQNGNCPWWLKSYRSNNMTPYVSGFDFESVSFEGNGFNEVIHEIQVNYSKLAVRPAVWVKI